ncbi:unnamed protein product [Protopolystoma xenopodis]|uniref:Uncharacterized protein n=1 Tax=Protopolystoma xenopodis TaxID=117903 RepID=A0A448XM99_9PLAT|nr:unnamed protein product [Protopolystoma xenopodis]
MHSGTGSSWPNKAPLESNHVEPASPQQSVCTPPPADPSIQGQDTIVLWVPMQTTAAAPMATPMPKMSSFFELEAVKASQINATTTSRTEQETVASTTQSQNVISSPKVPLVPQSQKDKCDLYNLEGSSQCPRSKVQQAGE